MKQLLLGGARSGKSRLAETLAANSAKTVIYIATTDVRFNDAEMSTRIEHHRQQRPSHWQTVECPQHLSQPLQEYNTPQYCLLIDCLTLWLTNCLLESEDTPNPLSAWQQESQAFINALTRSQADIIMVSNEVGCGIVPLGSLSRRFVDEAGFLHQQLAGLSDRVIHTVAGLPHVLKGEAL